MWGEVIIFHCLILFKKEISGFFARLRNSTGGADLNFQRMRRGGSGRQLPERLRIRRALSEYRCIWWKLFQNSIRCGDASHKTWDASRSRKRLQRRWEWSRRRYIIL